jgi:cytochrome c oxidase cbb3-type subunit IV
MRLRTTGEAAMTYEQASHFAQTWGLAFLVVLFAGVLIYAFWPGNREKFKRAAETPLNDGDDDGRQD